MDQCGIDPAAVVKLNEEAYGIWGCKPMDQRKLPRGTKREVVRIREVRGYENEPEATECPLYKSGLCRNNTECEPLINRYWKV